MVSLIGGIGVIFVWFAILAMLTVYLSTLSYALRESSMVKTAELVSDDEEVRRGWIEWFNRSERELKLVTAFGRFVSALGVFHCVATWWMSDVGFTVWELAKANLITLGLLLVCGVFVPNALTRSAGEPILAASRVVLWTMVRAGRPLTALGAGFDFVIMRLMGKSGTETEVRSERLEQEILDAVAQGEIQGAVQEGEKEMIASVFELRDTDTAAIMTPRTDIVAISADSEFEEVRQLIVRGGHSRVPVYQESLDHIIGVLYAKDLLNLKPGDAFDARKIMRAVPYVPGSKKLSDLLNELRQNQVHIAIVLDEYGGTAGLVTIEDILEEIVGEIADEYDLSEPPATRRVDDTTFELNATVSVSAANAEFGIRLPESPDYETVGGFVFSTLGRIPASGEEFTYAGLRVQVLDAEPRKINRLRIRMLAEEEARV